MSSGKQFSAGEIAGVAILTVAFGVAALVYSVTAKPPSLDSLNVASGTLQSYEEVRPKSRFGSATPRFKLTGHKRLFQYVSKAGDVGLVSNALRGSKGKFIEVYVDEDSPFKPVFEDDEVYTVYAVSIDGVVLREYDDVVAAWTSDNKSGVLMGAFFVFGGLSLAIIGIFGKLRAN